MLLQGGPGPYLESLERMRAALPELETVVPGHGPLGDGPAAISWLTGYLTRLAGEVADAFTAGRTLAETMDACSDPWAGGLDPALAAAIGRYPVPADRAREGMLGLFRQLHRLNILAVYRLAEAAASGGRG